MRRPPMGSSNGSMAVDAMGPLSDNSRCNKHIFVMNHHSIKRCENLPAPLIGADTIFNHRITHAGAPKHLQTDRDLILKIRHPGIASAFKDQEKTCSLR